MEPKDYTVIRIEGEYAYLCDDANPTAEPLFIALALLPTGTDEGTRLHCELFEYTIINWEAVFVHRLNQSEKTLPCRHGSVFFGYL